MTTLHGNWRGVIEEFRDRLPVTGASRSSQPASAMPFRQRSVACSRAKYEEFTKERECLLPAAERGEEAKPAPLRRTRLARS